MSAVRRQEGFTLVEVLIGMVLTVVVFGATLTALDAFSHQWQGGQQRLDAQDTARLGIDRIVRQLRNIASPVTTPKLLERATQFDIVFQTVGTRSGANVTGTERVRYCVPPNPSPGSTFSDVLYGETQTWSTATPPSSPWSSDPSAAVACDPSVAPPNGVTGAIVARAITNRYPYSGRSEQPAFRFNNSDSLPTDLGQVFTVQISLFVNPTPSSRNAEAQIGSAAFLRNQPRAPKAYLTPTATGGGGVLLNGGASYSPDGEDLTYDWACTSGCSATQAAQLASQDTGLVDWKPGAGTYTVTLTVTDQTGLATTSDPPTTVTVT